MLREYLNLNVEKDKLVEVQTSTDSQLCVDQKDNENINSQEVYVKKEDKSLLKWPVMSLKIDVS